MSKPSDAEKPFREAVIERIIAAARSGDGWLGTALNVELRETFERGFEAGKAEALAWRPIETAPRGEAFVHGRRERDPALLPIRIIMPYEPMPSDGWWCCKLSPVPLDETAPDKGDP